MDSSPLFVRCNVSRQGQGHQYFTALIKGSSAARLPPVSFRTAAFGREGKATTRCGQQKGSGWAVARSWAGPECRTAPGRALSTHVMLGCSVPGPRLPFHVGVGMEAPRAAAAPGRGRGGECGDGEKCQSSAVLREGRGAPGNGHCIHTASTLPGSSAALMSARAGK